LLRIPSLPALLSGLNHKNRSGANRRHRVVGNGTSTTHGVCLRSLKGKKKKRKEKRKGATSWHKGQQAAGWLEGRELRGTCTVNTH